MSARLANIGFPQLPSLALSWRYAALRTQIWNASYWQFLMGCTHRILISARGRCSKIYPTRTSKWSWLLGTWTAGDSGARSQAILWAQSRPCLLDVWKKSKDSPNSRFRMVEVIEAIWSRGRAETEIHLLRCWGWGSESVATLYCMLFMLRHVDVVWRVVFKAHWVTIGTWVTFRLRL